MNKEFAEGFMKNLGDLLEYCVENNTDSLELDFDINGKPLKVDITFSIGEVE